jgi:hypothetical protein
LLSSQIDQYIAEHYVGPRGCNGLVVARAREKRQWKTETCFVGTEY